MIGPKGVPAATWLYGEACAAVDMRDQWRSALSGVGTTGQAHSHHHRKLRSRGGDDSPANLVLLTGTGTTGEHGWIHGHPELATMLGYMVPSGSDPTLTPIFRLDQWGATWGWFVQADDATIAPASPPDIPLHILDRALTEFRDLAVAERRGALNRL